MRAESLRRRALATLICVAVLAWLPAKAAGQAPGQGQGQAKGQTQTKPPAKPPAKPAKPRVPSWEVEVHASFAIPSGSMSGTDQTPPQGPAFTLGDGSTPSRLVHSWLFGPGAALLNQVLQLRGLPQRIVGLDSSGWPVATYQPGLQAGGRVLRRLTDKLWLEFSADLALNPLGFDDEANSRIEETRASFVSAFTALNNSTPTLMPGATISAVANVSGGGRQLVTTGAVQFRASGTGLRPYLLGGAGFMVPIGPAASLELSGRYELTTPGGTVLAETDRTILRYSASPSFVVVAGFGFMRDLSPRSGWRAELRLLTGATNLEVRLDTDPIIAVSSPTGAAILNGTSPGLQFANNGLPTNLSAPPIKDFAAVDANGRTTQWILSGGYFWRF